MSWRGQNDEPFELLSVQRSDAPDGGQGKDWACYKIQQGHNVITGYRRGTLAAIKQAAEDIVLALNERRAPKRGRVQLVQLKRTAR